jgi:hypothetical protein
LARTDWEEQALAGVRRHYTREFRLAGESRIRDRIRFGLETARRQGIPEGPRSVQMAIGCALVPEGDPEFYSGLWARTLLKKVENDAAVQSRTAPPRPRPFSRTLTIRVSQMEALRGTVVEGFRGRMLAHFGRVFPERVRDIGQDAALALIDAAAAKAAECGIHGERSVAMLLDLMFVHGTDFDQTGPLRWTADLLRASDLPSEARMGAIYKILITQNQRRKTRGRAR